VLIKGRESEIETKSAKNCEMGMSKRSQVVLYRLPAEYVYGRTDDSAYLVKVRQPRQRVIEMSGLDMYRRRFDSDIRFRRVS